MKFWKKNENLTKKMKFGQKNEIFINNEIWPKKWSFDKKKEIWQKNEILTKKNKI